MDQRVIFSDRRKKGRFQHVSEEEWQRRINEVKEREGEQ